MIIMVLDHVRDYFTVIKYDPLDLTQTSALLFMTRWITHFCAPIFIFLSGTSAFLSLSKRPSKASASVFLLKRGIWLLILELTVIGFGWQFDLGFHLIFAQVIWAIGCSMIFLAALIFLKPWKIAFIGLLLIFGHNLFDHVHAADLNQASVFWSLLHETGPLKINNYETFFNFYPLIPWIGVMAAGYAFGNLFQFEPVIRKRLFIRIGVACLALFFILRFFNIYGDPYPWQHQDTLLKSILAFIKCNKYPPSLLYILMTLGTATLALSFLENVNSKFTEIFKVYGKVPLFFYVIHIYIVHCLQLTVAYFAGFSLKSMIAFPPPVSFPVSWGYSLPVIYIIWLSIVIALYLPCRWFMKVKQTRKNWWLSYL